MAPLLRSIDRGSIDRGGIDRGGRSLPISISGLSKSYGAVPVLDDVALDIGSGEFLTLLGPSGSGKTTLLMALAGFVTPEAGSIRFGDQEVVATPPHRRGIGVVFQSYALFPFMSAARNIAYPLKVRGMSKAEIAERVERALAMVELRGLGDRMIAQLSGGQRQRVAVARAIVFEPRIILMDEPLSALDKKLREQMQLEIKALHRKLDATIVYVTHDQREALTLSDRIAIMKDGRIVQVDTPADLYERPRSRFVADFIGESTLLPVEIVSGRASYCGAAIEAARGPANGGPHFLVIRPEKVSLLAGPPPPGTNCFAGRVTEVLFQGESLLLTVALAGETIVTVRRHGGQAHAIPEPGAAITLGLHRDDAVLVPEAAS